MEAEVLGLTATEVKVRRVSDNKEMPVLLASLCLEDKKFIADWAKRNSDIAQPGATAKVIAQPGATSNAKFSLAASVQTKKSDKAKSNSSDYRTTKLQMDVVIQNRELKRDLVGARGMFAVLTRSLTDTNDLRVLLLENFPLDVAANKKVTHSTPEMRIEYDNIQIKFGYKYQGHVLLIQDATGNNIFALGSPEDYTKLADRLPKLQQGQSIDRQLNVVKRVIQ
jgi:hypothetical protein